MKEPKLSRETYEQTIEIIRIGNRAVREAQAENYRLGLPNICSINGKNYLRNAGRRDYC